ncbi:hypothetical protein Nepgr_005042 [Nepenthes gracilis]|uniref:Growth-regulating factor n=1 Tax=Nepenthes gracilis TaxID=150966 RepID=A0AAD3S2J9_NEPGR|nr:hypothetical protein Nepgr_005042 [Nepenthes gracilis]
MEVGVVGLDVLATSENGLGSLYSGHETKQKSSGSGLLKQDRSEVANDDCRASKAAKNGGFSASSMLLLQNKDPFQLRYSPSDDGQQQQQQQQQQQMLSFSCSKPEASFLRNNGGLVDRSSEDSTLPYFRRAASAFSKNTGYFSGGLNTSMNLLNGVRGPFTPSQWLELQHQALIYKHIIANGPMTSNLLIPINKSLESSVFSNFTGGPLCGWGPFPLGFSNITDPEPGRCRRTDGKKWRCNRDAVADHKYCERHMNRGRHRSRKPVEGQTGHSVSGAATSIANTSTTKLAAVSSSSSTVVVPWGGTSNCVDIGHYQINDWQLHPANSPATLINRQILVNSESNSQGVQDTGLVSLDIDLNSRENSFPLLKQPIRYQEFAPSVFGVPSSDSLLNVSHKSSCLCSNNASAQDLIHRAHAARHPLCHFMEEWPKSRGDQSGILWPESERTQLSISIPVAPSDFMSSTSSPTHEKVGVLPLRLLQEHDLFEMGLGVGGASDDPYHRRPNWIPISWETSVGGPLGEVLQSSNGSSGDHKNTPALDLLSKSLGGSPQLSSSSSPTGVQQKISFGNNNAGSSPRAGHSKAVEGASLCSDLVGSKIVHSSSLPVL